MDWIQDNIFSILSLGIVLLGFAFNYGIFYAKTANLKDKIKSTEIEINKVQIRVTELESKTGQWERLDEKIIQMNKTLDTLVAKVDQFLMSKTKK